MTDKTIKKEEIKGIPEGSIAFPETEKSYAIAKESLEKIQNVSCF